MVKLPRKIEFVALGADEFADWRHSTLQGYAEQIMREGKSEQEAMAKALHDTDTLLSSGVQTPGHHIVHIVTQAEDARRVGYLWWFVADKEGARRAFIFDIEIDTPFRRRGYARAALGVLESWARREELASVSLHVFASNTGAIALYESLGYVMTTQQKMTLVLTDV